MPPRFRAPEDLLPSCALRIAKAAVVAIGLCPMAGPAEGLEVALVETQVGAAVDALYVVNESSDTGHAFLGAEAAIGFGCKMLSAQLLPVFAVTPVACAWPLALIEACELSP